MKKSITMFTIIFLLLAFHPLISAVKIYHTERSGGISSYVTNYGISGNWLVKCTNQISGRGSGGRRVELTPTNHKKYMSGKYQNIPSINIEIWNLKGSRQGPHASIETTGRPYKGTEYFIQVSGKKFSKIAISKFFGSNRNGWRGSELKKIIPLLIKYPRVKYSYRLSNKRVQGSVSLIGFTDAWNYAVKFVGYNPLR